LVVDATTGPERDQQARQFPRRSASTDSSHKAGRHGKGGVILGICDALKIPVGYVGVAKKVRTSKEFDAHQFVIALFEG